METSKELHREANRQFSKFVRFIGGFVQKPDHLKKQEVKLNCSIHDQMGFITQRHRSRSCETCHMWYRSGLHPQPHQRNEGESPEVPVSMDIDSQVIHSNFIVEIEDIFMNPLCHCGTFNCVLFQVRIHDVGLGPKRWSWWVSVAILVPSRSRDDWLYLLLQRGFGEFVHTFLHNPKQKNSPFPNCPIWVWWCHPLDTNSGIGLCCITSPDSQVSAERANSKSDVPINLLCCGEK